MEKYRRWYDAVSHCRAAGKPWVMATILGTQGSTPREAGAKMLITADRIYDTLGGGQLEFKVSLTAREMIEEGKPQQKFEYFPLSAKAQQCCGGTVNILLECFTPPKCEVHVFGAGHVGKCLITILGGLDIQVHWIDERPEQFPEQIPANTQVHASNKDKDLNAYIANMSPNAYSLILTHDHRLDYQLVSMLLDRRDCAFIGLIGSKSKALRFKKRFKTDAFSQDDIDKVICPVGLEAVPGKQPMEVAVSIAAQIIQSINHPTKKKESEGIYWQDVEISL